MASEPSGEQVNRVFTYRMASIPFVLTLTSTILHFAAGQSPCVTSSGEAGICESISKCNPLLNLVSLTSPATPMVFSYSFCGLDTATQTIQVCCPRQGCSTPNGAHGDCVELESCPQLMNTLQPSATLSAVQLVHKHICAYPEQDKVCCISETHKTISTNDHERCQLQAFLPDPKCCGYHATTSPRIIDGDETEIDEYPWVVLLEYRQSNGQLQPGCGGSLISGQYVLTAAQCIQQDAKPVSVRLGDYNITNPGIDSIPAAGGGLDHNNGELSVSVERIVVHPNYDYTTGHNDIAVIKLARIVEYTDFVRPICLPSDDFTMFRNPANVELYAAGWGISKLNAVVFSDIKRKVRMPYIPIQDCRSSTSNELYTQVWEGQVCAGGEVGKDICSGDEGGPLMRNVHGQYELVGIISFGLTTCGTEGVPSVYTKVFHYLSWIRSELKV